MVMRRALGLILVTVFACSDDSKGGGITDHATGGSAGSGPSGGGPGGAAGTAGVPVGSGGTQAAQGGSNAGSSTFTLPRVYPPVRAATPTALVAGTSYAAQPFRGGPDQPGFGTARQALSAISLATAIRERFYSTGPTDLLRIVKAVDDRVQGLDLTVAAHPCLATPPVEHTYVLPGGQTFQVKLQCLQHFGTPGANSGWVGFGRVRPVSADAGASGVAATSVAVDASVPADAGSGAGDAGSTATDGSDFYLIEGQEGGNGGAYHIDGQGNVEGWIAVAERDIPANSQVIMHLRTDNAAGTLELALAGSAVGFCAAHLKTDPTFLFVSGKTNAPPPPGTTQAVGTQYCDEPRSGCYRADNLATDLGSESVSCAAIGPSSFREGVELDSDTSADAGVNVVTTDIYSYFSQMPAGIPDF
jgi:hypothetical protein